jgi:glutaredoxin
VTRSKTATLHRMVLPDHICPWGLKARHVLRANGFAIEDHLLTSRAEVDAFKAEHAVKSTPQIWIDGQRIGGHDDLLRYLGKPVPDPAAVTYAPVIAIFAMAAAMALAAGWAASGALLSTRTAEWFVAFAMCLLALQKLRDVDAFSVQFLGYDLLAQRWVPYARLYPWLEGLAGVLMIAGVLHWLSIPIALFIGGIGAASVYYAVYIQKRDLKCACVGGNSNVPLGFVSLTENLMMVGMALWMVSKSAM